MLTKLIVLVGLLLGAFLGVAAQTTSAAASEPAAVSASQSTTGQSAVASHAGSIAGGQQPEAPALLRTSVQQTGRHFLGLPLKWVIVGVAAVVSVIAIAAIIHNRAHLPPCQYNCPAPHCDPTACNPG
ncbi:MAG: hypothetical protein ACRD1C_08585 [Terriglobales bacterium]